MHGIIKKPMVGKLENKRPSGLDDPLDLLPDESNIALRIIEI